MSQKCRCEIAVPVLVMSAETIAAKNGRQKQQQKSLQLSYPTRQTCLWYTLKGARFRRCMQGGIRT